YCRGNYWFVFSSRRRHTRFSRDWSSDVCSSDLHRPLPTPPAIRQRIGIDCDVELPAFLANQFKPLLQLLVGEVETGEVAGVGIKIGRASWREEVLVWESCRTFRDK